MKVNFVACEGCPAGQDGGLCQPIFALLMIEHYVQDRGLCQHIFALLMIEHYGQDGGLCQHIFALLMVIEHYGQPVVDD